MPHHPKPRNPQISARAVFFAGPSWQMSRDARSSGGQEDEAGHGRGWDSGVARGPGRGSPQMVELIGVRPDVKVRRRRQGRELVAPPQLCTRHCKPEGQGKKIPSFAGYMPGRCRPQALNHAPPGLRRSASVPYPAALYRSAGLSKDFRYWIPSRVSTVQSTPTRTVSETLVYLFLHSFSGRASIDVFVGCDRERGAGAGIQVL